MHAFDFFFFWFTDLAETVKKFSRIVIFYAFFFFNLYKRNSET